MAWNCSSHGDHFRPSHKGVWISPDSSAYLYEFSGIKAALAKLNLGNECLSLAYPLTQIGLSELRFFPGFHEKHDHPSVKV